MCDGRFSRSSFRELFGLVFEPRNRCGVALTVFHRGRMASVQLEIACNPVGGVANQPGNDILRLGIGRVDRQASQQAGGPIPDSIGGEMKALVEAMKGEG